MSYFSSGENQGWDLPALSGEATQAGKNFPMNGLAGIAKEYLPMSGEAANGEILFHYDC